MSSLRGKAWSLKPNFKINSILDQEYLTYAESGSDYSRVGLRFDIGFGPDYFFGRIAHVPSANKISPLIRDQFNGIGSPPVNPKVSTTTATVI